MFSRSDSHHEYYAESKQDFLSIRAYVKIERSYPIANQILNTACIELKETARRHIAGEATEEPCLYSRRVLEIFAEIIPQSSLRIPTHYIDLGFIDHRSKKSKSYYRFPVRLAVPGTDKSLNLNPLFKSLKDSIQLIEIPDSIYIPDKIAGCHAVDCLRALFAAYAEQRGYSEELALLTISPIVKNGLI